MHVLSWNYLSGGPWTGAYGWRAKHCVSRRLEIRGWQFIPRWIRMPHSDAYSHALGGQAGHQSSAEETGTAEHHNRGHYLLRHAGLMLETPTFCAIISKHGIE